MVNVVIFIFFLIVIIIDVLDIIVFTLRIFRNNASLASRFFLEELYNIFNGLWERIPVSRWS